MRSGPLFAETVCRALVLSALTGTLSVAGCAISISPAPVTSSLIVSDTHQNRALI
jgi:hypothetical protein